MDQVSQIRERTDIVDLIREHVALKKTGRNFQALCPFHSEKSPSFVVSPERQIWHCFGCQKGGDAYTFLMEYEHIDFPEALEILAKRAGIQLEKTQYQKGQQSKKEKIYTINHLASEFYHFVLTKHTAGKKALDYLLIKRKIPLPVINTYMLGFAPTSGFALSDYLLKKKKYPKEDILDSGIGFERRGRIIDFFRGRIVFPLIDQREHIVGFSGRSLIDKPTDGPKYINTRETMVYHKGSHFFGIHSAKDEIKKEEQAIIVEGEFDVISCFMNGIKNVVASKGTALTEAQVALLSRFAKKVSLCLDQDAAGQDAVLRSVQLLEKKGLLSSIIVVPNGKDPDESLKKDPYAFKKAVKEDIPVYDYLLNQALSRFSAKSAEGKKQIASFILPFFALIENNIVKEHYLKKLSNELETTYENILREEEKLSGKKTIEEQIQQVAKQKRERNEVLEEYLIALILQYAQPKEAVEKVLHVLSDFTFEIPVYQKILLSLVTFLQKNSEYDMNVFTQSLPQELLSACNTCYLLPLSSFDSSTSYLEEIVKIAKDLKVFYIRKRIKELADMIKEKEKTDETSEELELLKKELSSLISLLNLGK